MCIITIGKTDAKHFVLTQSERDDFSKRIWHISIHIQIHMLSSSHSFDIFRLDVIYEPKNRCYRKINHENGIYSVHHKSQYAVNEYWKIAASCIGVSDYYFLQLFFIDRIIFHMIYKIDSKETIIPKISTKKIFEMKMIHRILSRRPNIYIFAK